MKKSRIPLSPMDYYFFRKSLYAIQFVFEYSGHLNLQTFYGSVRKCTNVFHAVGSRIVICSQDRIELEMGHPISVKSRILEDEPLRDLRVEDYLDSVCTAEGEPLVKILVTQTPTRTFIGVSFSHLLGDGASFFHFLQGLCELSRGKEISVAMPNNQRNLLAGFAYSKRISGQSLFSATGYVTPRQENSENFALETLRYAQSDLRKNRNDLIRNGIRVTNNDILMAELAKRYHRDIPLHEGRFIVRCPVDYRQALHLPRGYFGNAVRDAIAVFEDGEVEALPLGEVALRIRQGIQSIDQTRIIESLQSLEALRKDHGLSIFEDVGCPGLLVCNFLTAPFDKIDFGIGAPIAFHHGSLSPRQALILPTAHGIELRFKRPLKSEATTHEPLAG